MDIASWAAASAAARHYISAVPPRLPLKRKHHHELRKESPGSCKLSLARSLLFVAEPRTSEIFNLPKNQQSAH
jgi:hypothetical protein